jgi:DNA topoisomerase-1
MGHITDLEKGNNAIDKEHDFAPTYIVSPDKKAVVTALRRAAKQMKQVWIATDEDREGEAIGWHLCRELNLDIAKTPRIVFHEITKDAIQHAVKNPRTLDVDLVDAQQARRILDRLV